MNFTLCTRAALAATLLAFNTVASADGLDLDDPHQLLDAYVKTVGDTSERETMVYARSTVFAFVPGQRGRPILGMEVVGVKRYERIEGGWQRVQREIAFYTDPDTGEILDSWHNPWLDREVRVIPVLNDPVNRRHVIDEQGGGWSVNYMRHGDHVTFYREIPLRYPNPLPYSEYPLHSTGDWYEAMELFNNFVSLADLEDPEITSAPGTGSWTRVGPWLPWMEMGNRPGWLVYHGRSVKLMDGAEALPDHVREAIERDYPKYLRAPSEWSEPSETSWTLFRKVLDGEVDLDEAGRE